MEMAETQLARLNISGNETLVTQVIETIFEEMEVLMQVTLKLVMTAIDPMEMDEVHIALLSMALFVRELLVIEVDEEMELSKPGIQSSEMMEIEIVEMGEAILVLSSQDMIVVVVQVYEHPNEEMG